MNTHADAFNKGFEDGKSLMEKITGFTLNEVFLSTVQNVYQTLLQNLDGIDIELKHAVKDKNFDQEGVEIILSRRKQSGTNTTIEHLAQIGLRTGKSNDEFTMEFESLNADCYRARGNMLGAVLRQTDLNVYGTKIGDHYAYREIDKALADLGALVAVSIIDIPQEKRTTLKPQP